MKMLKTITELSHKFGTDDYVKGGGGNTSVKDQNTLWVKPSGITLSGITPNTFIALDRGKIELLYDAEIPQEASAREELVKNIMTDSLLPETSGRASVEAPLHNIFEYRYVVHTHPPYVNGMCCAVDGKEVCQKLFPEAMWMDYADPGYTLCMQTKNEIENFKAEFGNQPKVIFMKNHGVFVAADTEEEMSNLYTNIMTKLQEEYRNAGIATGLKKSPASNNDARSETESAIKEVLGDPGKYVVVSNWFKVPENALTPDHIVYMKSHPLFGKVTKESIDSFVAKNGYTPKVVVTDNAVFGIGDSTKNAKLALIIAEDGAQVMQLSKVFGGVEFMTKQASDFIDNWEVEAYRRKQAS